MAVERCKAYDESITSASSLSGKDGLCDCSCHSRGFDCFGVGCAAQRDCEGSGGEEEKGAEGGWGVHVEDVLLNG